MARDLRGEQEARWEAEQPLLLTEAALGASSLLSWARGQTPTKD